MKIIKQEKTDQIHLRGAKGKVIFTEKIINMIKNLDNKQTAYIPKTKEGSRRKEGSIPTFSLPPSPSFTFCCSTSCCHLCKDELV